MESVRTHKPLASLLLLFFCIEFVSGIYIPPPVRYPPTIIKQSPKIKHALPNEKTVLDCEADASPAVKEFGKYYWTKDGQFLNFTTANIGNNSVQLTMPGPHGSLVFNGSELLSPKKLSPYEGIYQCFANNKWGTAISTEIELRIASMAPYQKPENEIKKVREGDPLEISCETGDKKTRDDIDFKWQYIPKTFQPTQRISEAPGGRIIFSNIQKSDDSLEFYCQLKYLATRSSTDLKHYTLTVNSDEIAKDTPPNIAFPRNATDTIVAMKGEKLSLTCIAIGKPTPSISWSRKGKSLQGEDENRYELDDFNKTLRITDVRYSDAGIYECLATNDLGNTTHEVKVVVEAKPYFANDTAMPKDIVVEPGSDVKITCEPEGTPRPNVTWMKNGQILNDYNVGGVTTNVILLQNVTTNDTAVFQCIGRNKHGSVMRQGFVNILAIPPVPMPDNKRLYRAVEGTSVIIECEMFSVSSYTLEWTKVNHPRKDLLSNTRISRRYDQSLNIGNVTLDDSGDYRCRGENKYGSRAINMTLLVMDKTSVEPEDYKMSYHVLRGANVTMRVKVFNHPNLEPKRVYWSNKGRLRGIGKSLTIESVTQDDAGKYTIIVETELDNAATVIELVVQDVPGRPKNLVFSISDTDRFAGSLSWTRPNPNSSPIKTYYIDVLAYTDIYTGEWRNFKKTLDGDVTEYDISDLKPWVNYSFRVWAENGIGRSRFPSIQTDSYRTPAAAPKVNPTGVTGEGDAPDSMVIKWNTVDPLKHGGPEFGYYVRWCLSSNCSWMEDFVDRNETSLTVTGLPQYSEYHITVKSVNKEGSGPEPEPATGFSGQDIPLESPSFSYCNVDNNSQAILRWKPVPSEKMRGIAVEYVIRAKDIQSGNVQEKRVGPDETETSMKLEPFTNYQVTVAVKNGAGESNLSKTINFTTPTDIPDPPENFSAVKQTSTDLDLKWEEPRKRKGVIIRYILTYKWEEENQLKSAKLQINERRLKLSNLNPNTRFNLTLCAETSRGIGDMCAKLAASTLPSRKPAPPQVEVITNQNSANVTWEIADKDWEDKITTESYRVEHRTITEGDGKWISSKPISATKMHRTYNYTVPKLAPGTEYEFRIWAKNKYGETASNSTTERTTAVGQESASKGGQLWLIIVLCIAVVVILAVVMACFMRKRKEGKYPVSEKEEQLVKLESQPMSSKDFGKYCETKDDEKAENGDVPDNGRPPSTRRSRLRGDSVGGNSIEAFESGGGQEYDEDGSFIDQYGLEPGSHSKVSSPESVESKEMANAQTRLLSETGQNAV